MANRVRRSAALFKASWAVLRAHRSLILFPIISAAATLLVIASFAAPVIATMAMDDDLRNEVVAEMDANSEERNPAEATVPRDSTGTANEVSTVWKATGIAYLLAFYLAMSFVVIFFNAALIAAANEHFSGRPTGVAVGMRAASRRLPQILGWAVVSALVGTILRAISERAGIFGRIVIALIGMAWSIASYFAIPAVVIEGVGPFKAIGLSVSTLKETWGESLVIAVGFRIIGMITTLLGIGMIVAGVVMIGTGTTENSAGGVALEALGAATCLAGVATIACWLILEGTLRGITQTALYRFAKNGEVPEGFLRADLEAAFKPKTHKSFRLG